MEDTALDMELTPEREEKIKEVLLRLFVEQHGWECVTVAEKASGFVCEQ